MNTCSIYCEGDNHEFSESEHVDTTDTLFIFEIECIKCNKRFRELEQKDYPYEVIFSEEIQ